MTLEEYAAWLVGGDARAENAALDARHVPKCEHGIDVEHPCVSCDPPATRGTAHLTHLRIWKAGGYWTTEMYQGGEVREAYVGEPDARAAFERGLMWLRAEEQRQLPASLARNETT